LGKRGETAVADWYRRAGYELLEANWRCADGEIDLIVESPDRNAYVFCEVKTRNSKAFGSPLEAVTLAKQRRLRRLAARWLEERRNACSVGEARFHSVRFDVASVMGLGEGSLTVEVLEAAF